MSSRLKGCGDFLRTLLKGSLLQAEAVLVTATNKQVDCVGEIIYNLRRLPLSKKSKAIVVKYKKILEVVSDLGLKVKNRLVIIQKYTNKNLSVLMSVKNRLLSLLSTRQES